MIQTKDLSIAERAFLSSLEKIKANIRWMDTIGRGIRMWLSTKYGDMLKKNIVRKKNFVCVCFCFFPFVFYIKEMKKRKKYISWEFRPQICIVVSRLDSI